MQNRLTLSTIILAIKLLSAYAIDNEIPTECPQVDPIDTTIHIAHEFDCTKFYSCSNGRKILMMCPLMDGAGNKLHFNPKLQVCDWPNRAGCNLTSSTTSTTTTSIPTELTSESTEWVITTESTEINNSSEVTEITTESSESSTEDVSSDTASPTTQETTSEPSESTSVTTQKPLPSNSTTTEVLPSVTTQSTASETESTSESTGNPSAPSSIVTEASESTDKSTESSTFLPSSTALITNQTEITTTTAQITTINPTIITTDDFDSNDTATTLPTPLPQCTSEVSGVLYPHESDCSLFYNCDHGKLVLLSCPGGLYFDEPRQICVWPYETNCKTSTAQDPSTTVSTVSTASSTTKPTNVSDLCPTDNSNDGILYPHECVCSKFYVCTNGQLILNQCPAGLNFNSKLNICDWPENVQCQSSSTTELLTSTISSETIKPIDPNSTKSGNLIDQSTVSKSECPEDGSDSLLPHETNCRLYYECKSGKKWLKECSTGLEFNPSLEFCDRPETAGCSNSESNKRTTLNEILTSGSEETSSSVVESSTIKNESSVSTESSVIVSTTLSSDKCLRACPENDPIDYTVLVENENCTKFCKCSHGIPYVLNCPAGLEFNSLLQTCDYPERANCTRQQAA